MFLISHNIRETIKIKGEIPVGSTGTIALKA